MKKLISFVLTAAMVASLVPATAFAADIEGTAVPVNAIDFTKDEAKDDQHIIDGDDLHPQVKITLDKVNVHKNATTPASFTVELALDNAEWDDDVTEARFADNGTDLVKMWDDDGDVKDDFDIEVVSFDDDDMDYVKFKVFVPVTGVDAIDKGDYLTVDLDTVLTKWSVGTLATVTVDGVAQADDLVFASVEARGITAETRKVGYVAEEEFNTLSKDLKIASNVGDFYSGQRFELRLSKGFEFKAVVDEKEAEDDSDYALDFYDLENNTVWVEFTAPVDGTAIDEIVIDADWIEIEATTAKAGAVCTMTVNARRADPVVAGDNTFAAKATVEVMEVVDYTVILSVDEDEDVPVIYSGVNVENYGITDDSDHLSLEITAEETFPGAWSFRKGFSFELPEGVYVTNVEVIEQEGFVVTEIQNTEDDAEDDEVAVGDDEMMAAFFNAYQEGDHVNFEFEKRVFDDVDAILGDTEAKVTFQLELVADPTFVGDVTLKLTGDLIDEQEVVIAKFVPAYIVKAEQNDLKIDYRYTEIPTVITIEEAEAGLWAKDEAAFGLYVEKADYIVFEDDPVFTVNEESGMELADAELREFNDIVEIGLEADVPADDEDTTPVIAATVDKESDVPAVITISGMSLFMARDIPAGPYDLKGVTSMAVAYEREELFAPDCVELPEDVTDYAWDVLAVCQDDEDLCDDCLVADVCDYSETVKEAFINVVTAGREQDDNSFTTVVKVPVGENVLYAGEVTVELDVPAYINANGYTMLPVRAVATALGINNNNVLWDQATKTVTILYGQRIITMQVGANVVYVNGSAIPATSSVEIVDGRTFLGLRDLATALGVTTIDWDAASKTALLNAEFEA